MGFSVGKSSYGDLKDVEQFVATQDIADQVASLCHEFDTQVAKNGDRLTVNEGIRSHVRQDLLYSEYLAGTGALAAYPYTSTHDATRGSALDFGITDKSGNNRALTSAEFAWLHSNGVRRGIVHTGAYFNPEEEWHHNGGYAATVAPISGVNLPGEPLNNSKQAADAAPKEDDFDMKITWNATGGIATLWVGGKFWQVSNLVVAGATIKGPQIVKLLQRLINSDQSKSYPEKFNDLEIVIIKAALGKVK